MKLPDMPIGALSLAATVHNGNVYIRARHRDKSSGKWVRPVLVYSTSKHKWSAFPEQQGGATVAVVRNCFTLIGRAMYQQERSPISSPPGMKKMVENKYCHPCQQDGHLQLHFVMPTSSWLQVE